MLRFRYVPDRNKIDKNANKKTSVTRTKSLTSSSVSIPQSVIDSLTSVTRWAKSTSTATTTTSDGLRSVKCNHVDSGHYKPWFALECTEDDHCNTSSHSVPATDIMYQHISSRRRKKRPIHGTRTVLVMRGRSGYGFTISGQNPCVLSCIVGGSPADQAGLKAGDYLYVVNGINVSQAPHDIVVRMVGESRGTLELQVAENYNSSDSSEDDYMPRTKSRYPNRVRFRQLQMESSNDVMASRPLPQRPIDLKASIGKPRKHVPVGAESDFSTSLTSPLSSVSEDKSKNDQPHGWKESSYETIAPGEMSVRFQNGSQNKQREGNCSTTDLSGENFAFTTVQNGPVISTAKISSAVPKRPPSRNHEFYSSKSTLNHQAFEEVENGDCNSCDDNIPPINDGGKQGRDGEEEEAAPGSEACAVVGYIGSIELPGNATRPTQRLQLLRNAVRRLRVEKKIHTLVLMEVNSDGVYLNSSVGNMIAHYPVEKLAFSGICPDDKRYFGIVTLHTASDDVSEISGLVEDRSPGSSCHVFMVDPDMCSHVLHSHKAKAFNLHCTQNSNAQRCLEFPQSPTHLILCIVNLYRDRPRSKLDSDIIQSNAFADPSRPAERSNSNSSNSDSGLGFGREDGTAEQVCVVDMPVENHNNVRSSAGTPNSCKSMVSLQQRLSPAIHSMYTPRGVNRPLSAFEMRRGMNNSSSSEECWAGMGLVDKLTPRAMPDPTSRYLPRAASTDRLENNPSTENLRQSMQRLLQARQQRLQHDQTVISDSESQSSSRVNLEALATRSAFQVPRPVSAPLRSNGWHQRTSGVEMVDMGLGKLSPRAFPHPAHTLRSPSAPPIPYFPHQDSDDDDDDTESEDDPFVRKIISQFNRDRVLDFGEENPRRFSEGFALSQKRDKDWSELEDLQKWTKSGSFRRTHNMKVKANMSQSHESLMMGGEENVCSPNQKLMTASAHCIPQQIAPVTESGRVAGWAVGFHRLLADRAGLAIFTEFLRKEFSEENIIFWNTVETFRQICDDSLRKARAKDIFNKHLGPQATDPVNVDSTARQIAERYLDNATPNIFDIAQQQIFQLMRQDSYVRFLKSDLYKGHLIREMEGQSLAETKAEMPPPPADDDKKKGKGKENEEKKRRSFIPWRQNKKSIKVSSDLEPKKLTKGREKEKDEKKDKEVNNNHKKGPGPGIDLSTMRKEVFNPKEVDKQEAQVKFCRVVMPDRSTTVVCTRPGQNIRTVLGKLCEKRGLSIASVDIFLLGSDKPLDLGEDISTLGSKEVVIERRVLFRLDLPNHKSIGVKAKPNRSIRDVFKPILNKYGYRIDNVGVQLSGMSELLDIDIPVLDIDNQRVIIIANPSVEIAETPSAGNLNPARAPPRHRRTPLLLPSRAHGGKGGSLEEITNKIFDDLMKGKSELAHTFDELGVVDLERSKTPRNTEEHRSLGLFGLLKKDSMGAKETSKQKSKGKVTFALPRSDSKKNKNKAEEERLMELIERANSQYLEEQCATTVITGQMPEFVCTDAVEHIDMRVNEPATSLPLSTFGFDKENEVIAPVAELFDDVQYMHSSPIHDFSGSEWDDPVDFKPEPSSNVNPRIINHFSTFGTPRSTGKVLGNNSNKNEAFSALEGMNFHQSMQPLIVDTKAKTRESQFKQTSGLQSLNQSLSAHFEGVKPFRPVKGAQLTSTKSPVVSPNKISSGKSKISSTVGPHVSDLSNKQLKTEIEKCTNLSQSGVQGLSVKSNNVQLSRPDSWHGGPVDFLSQCSLQAPPNPSLIMKHGQLVRSDVNQSIEIIGNPNHRFDTKAEVHNATLPPTSPAILPGDRLEEFVPKYISPPPYSAEARQKQVHSASKSTYNAKLHLRRQLTASSPQLNEESVNSGVQDILPSKVLSRTDSRKDSIIQSPKDIKQWNSSSTLRESPKDLSVKDSKTDLLNSSALLQGPPDLWQKQIVSKADIPSDLMLSSSSKNVIWHRSQTPDLISTRRSSAGGGHNSTVVVADVHYCKDQEFKLSKVQYNGALSVDSTAFSDQTVTFV